MLLLRHNLFLSMCKNKNERETTTNRFCLTMGKTSFAYFGSLKKILNQSELKIFFLTIVLFRKMKLFANKNKAINFNGLCDFWKMKILPTFWKRLKNRQKVLYHSTLKYIFLLGKVIRK